MSAAITTNHTPHSPPCPSPPCRAGGRVWLWSVAPLALYLALAFLLFARTWAAPTRRHIGYPGDPPQFMWFLSWTAFALGHHLSPLVSTYLDYPRGVNLMWNAALLWPGAVLTPITVLLGPVFAYNLLVTLALPLSGWCAYLAIRRWTSRASATIGGLLFAFSPQMAAQGLVHAPVVLALTPPLVLLLLTDLLVQRRWPALVSGGALGVVAAAQVLTWSELLATTALMAAVGVVLGRTLQRKRPHIARYVGVVRRGALGALVTFLLIAGVPLLVEFRGPQRIQGLLHQGAPLTADLFNFVVPTSTQLLTPPVAARLSARFATNVPEANAYLGLPLLALLVYIVIRWRRRSLVRWAGLLAAIAAVFSLGAYLHVDGHVTAIPLPWLLAARLPLMRYVMPSRLAVFVILAAGLLLAFFLDRLREQTPRRRLAGIVVVAVALLPLLPRLPYPTSSSAVPAFFGGAGARRVPEGSVALLAPFAALEAHTYSAPMLWQGVAKLRFRMPEGYAFVPNPSGDASMRPWPSMTQSVMLGIQAGKRSPDLTGTLRARIARDLREWRVRTVIVGPMDHQGEMLRVFRFLLQREPEHVSDVYVWWGVRG